MKRFQASAEYRQVFGKSELKVVGYAVMYPNGVTEFESKDRNRVEFMAAEISNDKPWKEAWIVPRGMDTETFITKYGLTEYKVVYKKGVKVSGNLPNIGEIL